MMLGDTTTTGATTEPLGFMDGAKLWLTPGEALTAAKDVVTHVSTSFTGDELGFSLGVLAPPLVLMMLFTGGGRRF